MLCLRSHSLSTQRLPQCLRINRARPGTWSPSRPAGVSGQSAKNLQQLVLLGTPEADLLREQLGLRAIRDVRPCAHPRHAGNGATPLRIPRASAVHLSLAARSASSTRPGSCCAAGRSTTRHPQTVPGGTPALLRPARARAIAVRPYLPSVGRPCPTGGSSSTPLYSIHGARVSAHRTRSPSGRCCASAYNCVIGFSDHREIVAVQIGEAGPSL